MLEVQQAMDKGTTSISEFRPSSPIFSCPIFFKLTNFVAGKYWKTLPQAERDEWDVKGRAHTG